ncbi:KPN_02809 family neutral zinc metallopeptidase [Massilia glaciei]|uniref:Metalloprotease n=1 Tax=Massilia glaciei TaxID=1524097 RepID=A0A2U2HME2_9BURK|nr:neutral zinc metallopeptidase [Massilia glaciei]PWF48688.1 metalloprotease [Massilia glaciei]
MKWEGGRESDNVEDRRGSGGGGFGGKSIGIGTIVIALVGSYIFGVSPSTVLEVIGGGGAGEQQQGPAGPPINDRDSKFVKTVLADTEDAWGALFRAQGATYQPPTLTLFSDRTPTACGTGQSASGPFYCPGDQKVYIDLSFFRLMKERFNVAGDFAQAYVIAHEVGHHVQHLMGTSQKMQEVRRQGSESQVNAMSVRMELQADCYAGVWAFHTNQKRQILEGGDVEAALKAATAIGDDALQRQGGGAVVPDSFTHGTSEQRARWFSKGLENGKVEGCNTFDTRNL